MCIKETIQRFCETSTVKDRKRSGRPSKIREEKVDEVHHVCGNEPQSSVRAVATICSIPRTTRTIAHRTMTEYLLMKLYNV